MPDGRRFSLTALMEGLAVYTNTIVVGYMNCCRSNDIREVYPFSKEKAKDSTLAPSSYWFNKILRNVPDKTKSKGSRWVYYCSTKKGTTTIAQSAEGTSKFITYMDKPALPFPENIPEEEIIMETGNPPLNFCVTMNTEHAERVQ
jgi:hypothetical protein